MVSLPTSVLNQIVVSKLSENIIGPLTCLLLTFLTKNNYCLSCAVFLAAAARRLDFLCIKQLSISSTFSSTCLLPCFLHFLTAYKTTCTTVPLFVVEKYVYIIHQEYYVTV